MILRGRSTCLGSQGRQRCPSTTPEIIPFRTTCPEKGAARSAGLAFNGLYLFYFFPVPIASFRPAHLEHEPEPQP